MWIVLFIWGLHLKWSLWVQIPLALMAAYSFESFSTKPKPAENYNELANF